MFPTMPKKIFNKLNAHCMTKVDSYREQVETNRGDFETSEKEFFIHCTDAQNFKSIIGWELKNEVDWIKSRRNIFLDVFCEKSDNCSLLAATSFFFKVNDDPQRAVVEISFTPKFNQTAGGIALHFDFLKSHGSNFSNFRTSRKKRSRIAPRLLLLNQKTFRDEPTITQIESIYRRGAMSA